MSKEASCSSSPARTTRVSLPNEDPAVLGRVGLGRGTRPRLSIEERNARGFSLLLLFI